MNRKRGSKNQLSLSQSLFQKKASKCDIINHSSLNLTNSNNVKQNNQELCESTGNSNSSRDSDDSFELFLPRKIVPKVSSSSQSSIFGGQKKSKYFNRNGKLSIPKEIKDDDLELALAISLEESKGSIVDLKPTKKGQPLHPKGKQKKCYTQSLLMRRTADERERIITEKVGIVLTNLDKITSSTIDDSTNAPFPLSSSYLKSRINEPKTLWKLSQSDLSTVRMQEFFIEVILEYTNSFTVEKIQSSNPIESIADAQVPECENSHNSSSEDIFDSDEGSVKIPSPKRFRADDDSRNTQEVDTHNIEVEMEMKETEPQTAIHTPYKNVEVEGKRLVIDNYLSPYQDLSHTHLHTSTPTSITFPNTEQSSSKTEESINVKHCRKLVDDMRHLSNLSESTLILLKKSFRTLFVHGCVFQVRCPALLEELKRNNGCLDEYSTTVCDALFDYIYTANLDKCLQLEISEKLQLVDCCKKYKISLLAEELEPHCKNNIYPNEVLCSTPFSNSRIKVVSPVQNSDSIAKCHQTPPKVDSAYCKASTSMVNLNDCSVVDPVDLSHDKFHSGSTEEATINESSNDAVSAGNTVENDDVYSVSTTSVGNTSNHSAEDDILSIATVGGMTDSGSELCTTVVDVHNELEADFGEVTIVNTLNVVDSVRPVSVDDRAVSSPEVVDEFHETLPLKGDSVNYKASTSDPIIERTANKLTCSSRTLKGIQNKSQTDFDVIESMNMLDADDVISVKTSTESDVSVLTDDEELDRYIKSKNKLTQAEISNKSDHPRTQTHQNHHLPNPLAPSEPKSTTPRKNAPSLNLSISPNKKGRTDSTMANKIPAVSPNKNVQYVGSISSDASSPESTIIQPRPSINRYFQDSFPSLNEDDLIPSPSTSRCDLPKTAEQNLATPGPSGLGRITNCVTPAGRLIVSDKATPLPDYATMKSPDLKKELSKYGLKPDLSRGKAVSLLNCIYEQIHPPIDDPNVAKAISDVQFGANKDKSSSDSDNDVYSLSSDSSNENVELFEQFEDLVPSQQINTTDRICGLIKEVGGYIKSNFALYSEILKYTPVWLDLFHNDVKNQGIKCNRKELMAVLDELGVTFRFKMARQRQEKPKKRKKRRKQLTAQS